MKRNQRNHRHHQRRRVRRVWERAVLLLRKTSLLGEDSCCRGGIVNTRFGCCGALPIRRPRPKALWRFRVGTSNSLSGRNDLHNDLCSHANSKVDIEDISSILNLSFNSFSRDNLLINFLVSVFTSYKNFTSVPFNLGRTCFSTMSLHSPPSNKASLNNRHSIIGFLSISTATFSSFRICFLAFFSRSFSSSVL